MRFLFAGDGSLNEGWHEVGGLISAFEWFIHLFPWCSRRTFIANPEKGSIGRFLKGVKLSPLGLSLLVCFVVCLTGIMLEGSVPVHYVSERSLEQLKPWSSWCLQFFELHLQLGTKAMVQKAKATDYQSQHGWCLLTALCCPTVWDLKWHNEIHIHQILRPRETHGRQSKEGAETACWFKVQRFMGIPAVHPPMPSPKK